MRFQVPNAHRRIALAVAVGWASISATRADDQPSEGEALILRAHALTGAAETDEQYTKIIDLSRKASEHGLSVDLVRYNNRLRSWAHNRRGEERRKSGDLDTAAVDFEVAVGLNPLNWRALHNRAVSSLHKRRWDRALADLDKVLRFQNELAEAYYHRAEARRELGHFEKARADYDIYIDAHPGNAEAYAGRGISLFELGQRKSAVADLYNALKLDPKNVSALVYRGEVFTKIGLYDKAARDLRNAIELEPDAGRAYRSAAWLMATCPKESLRNDTLALEAAQKAVDMLERPAFGELDVLAAAQANRGDFDAAKQTLTKAMKIATNAQRQILATRLELYQRSKPYRLASGTKPAKIAEGPVDGPAFR